MKNRIKIALVVISALLLTILCCLSEAHAEEENIREIHNTRISLQTDLILFGNELGYSVMNGQLEFTAALGDPVALAASIGLVDCIAKNIFSGQEECGDPVKGAYGLDMGVRWHMTDWTASPFISGGLNMAWLDMRHHQDIFAIMPRLSFGFEWRSEAGFAVDLMGSTYINPEADSDDKIFLGLIPSLHLGWAF